MTYTSIYTEVANIRFNSSTAEIARVKNWVNAAEVELWNAADWVFKRVPVTNLTVTAGAATEPADFGKALALYNASGDPVRYLSPDRFEAAYSVGTPPTGTGAAFTVINRQIIVGPADTGTYKLAYKRRYAHLNNASAVTAGVMSVDTDTPIWDSEHHYALVPRAIVIGARLENDPLPQNYQEDSDRRTAAMVKELVGGVSGEVRQWGSAS